MSIFLIVFALTAPATLPASCSRMNKRTQLCWAYLALLVVCGSALADQTQIANYNRARELHWRELYPQGSWTLYCGERFADRTGLNVEHLYAASWMGAHLGCGTRRQCRQTNARFNRMEADLHNLYPSLASVNRARSNYLFANIAGEVREFGQCDFERSTANRVAEPRPVARGM